MLCLYLDLDLDLHKRRYNVIDNYGYSYMKQDFVKIACGTDDGINFTKEHFGSASFYLIYFFNLKTGEIKKIEERKNTSIEEEMHGDPKKAQSISALLKDVQVLVAFVMGPNIVRIRKKFLPIISRERSIKIALEKLKKQSNKIRQELKKKTGIDKEIIYLKI